MQTTDELCLDARDITPSKAFGLLKASVVPRPIAWTSTVGTDGVNNLAPFSFFTVVSSDPPMVLLSLEFLDGGLPKDSAANIEATGEFVVNIAPSAYARAVDLTSTAHVIPLFAIYTFGPDIMSEIGIGHDNSYLAELLISVLFLVGDIPGLLLVDKIGRKPLLIYTFVIMSAAFVFMAVNPGAPAALLFAALAVYAITSGACNFIEIIYPNELFPTAVRATATGTVVAISRIGSAVSTFVLPMVLTGSGLGGVMWLLAGVNIVGLAVTVLLGEETRGRALSETSAASPERVSVPT